ncbi:hypothetical protein OESDEN_22636 [Oesophagostomum dentatum]|uniref:G-protein coupled receptors family 1 profile domain-containing protein n=1 Tax=Oesophagostomum dentatum TaxID=61180 RepID=A0A0B1RYI5_OESDE|nr:hypothetical protein OESDEN_22636 [Oesophagostomum dentatum]
MKNIYRSLILISATVVFGWFSGTVIALFVRLLHTEIALLHVDLLVGIFINFACALNFFVYFVTSKEYRQVFNEYVFFCAANISSDARSSKTGEKTAERATALPSVKSTVTARNERL